MKYLLLISIFYISIVKGQEEVSYVSTDQTIQEIPFKDRLFTGGNVGFNIFNGLMYLEVAPILGYKVNEKFSAGISGKFMRLGAINNNQTFRSFYYYGGGLFTRYQFTESILASVEYELLNVEQLNPNSSDFGNRTLSNVLLVGGGYNSRISDNIRAQLFVLYDVIDDPNSPYRFNYLFGPNALPIIYRIGFSLGF